MRYIRRRTRLPVPETLFYCCTLHSEGFGYPHIIFQYLPGKPIAEVWGHAVKYNSDLEQRRQKILCSLAHTMSRLQNLSFDASGSLYLDHDHDDNPQVSGRFMVDESGYPDRYPYYDPSYRKTRSHIRENLVDWWEESKVAVQFDTNHFSPEAMEAYEKFKILSMAINCIPTWEETDEEGRCCETFVLALPEFDSQNILIDEEGNVTGILDWDGAHTVPRFAGFSALPMWHTRDFTSGYWE